MADEIKIESPALFNSNSANPEAAVLKSEPSTKLVGQDVASENDETQSILKSSISSSGNATSGVKDETGQESVTEQGYNGTSTQSNDQNHFKAGDGSATGFQSDNGSLLYYMPGYDPYATGPFMGVDGQQPFYSSPGYHQHVVSYGSEAMPCYTRSSACVEDVANETAGFLEKSKPAHGSNATTKSKSFNSIISSGTLASKTSPVPLDSKSRKSVASTNSPKFILKSPPPTTVGKLGSGYQSASLGKFSSYMNQNRGLLMHNSPMSYRPHGRIWNGNNKINSRDKYGESNASIELLRGPRGQNGTNSSNPPEEEQFGPSIQRELYNVEEFQVEYENAKFFVIKSYSEDDIHKSIKYDVWSSTAKGNKKLDAAFRDAEAKASETRTKFPVFLFFSVNGSGQFVGLAEMIGQVDFNKDMDFWQLDKWNGFFPVKWHIIKDTPNTQFRHIILENNDNEAVTFSRDTQEIGLRQGIEMLNIFKSYLLKTSILDDFNFYENREKSLRARRNNQKASSPRERYEYRDFPKHMETRERTTEGAVRSNGSLDPTSLITLTKNLSLNPHPVKSGPSTKMTQNSGPSITAPKPI